MARSTQKLEDKEEMMQRSPSLSKQESTQKLEQQFKELARLEKSIRESLRGLDCGN